MIMYKDTIEVVSIEDHNIKARILVFTTHNGIDGSDIERIFIDGRWWVEESKYKRLKSLLDAANRWIANSRYQKRREASILQMV